MSDEQSFIIRVSAQHNFMHENWSHQTRAVNGGDIGIWFRNKIVFKGRREFELGDQRFF